ncbi:MAG: hypothetical protein NTW95_14515 [Candidatus Aminicenantes bacterium]|nr:hypothetical protein [Candidatus Aminicenantes bacterium]
MKKSKLALTAMLALLCVSAAGCLFSLVYGRWQDVSRRNHLRTFRDLAGQEKAAQALDAEYREWSDLPQALQKFRQDNILSLDEFAAFRRDLDASLAANGLQPPRIDFAFGSGSEGFRKVTAKFSLSGSYRSLKKFIYDMETKPKMHFFSSLQLSVAADLVKGGFTLEVYLGE